MHRKIPLSASASALLLLFLLSSLFPLSARQVQLRSRVELVLVPVTVKGRNGSLVAGLTKESFTINEGRSRQSITSFSVDPVPISAVVLVDTGISENALTRVKNSFPAMMGAFADDDELAVYRFDKHVEKLVDFSSDRAEIDRAFEKLLNATPSTTALSGPYSPPGPIINGTPIIPGVQAAGRTTAPTSKVLHDAVLLAAEALSTRSIDRRRIVLLASDGRNHNSLSSYSTALERLLMQEVQVFAFGVDTSLFQRLRSPLTSYAKETGGNSWFPDSQEALEEAYPRTTEEARNQYVLGYISTNKRPASKPVFRGIKVQVSQSGTEVNHKKGYYQAP